MPIDVTIAQVLTNTNELNVLLRFDYHLQNATKKHHIEEQLEKASASFEVINALDMLDDPVVIFDDKWRYQFINKAGWNVLDEDRAEVLGRNVWQLRPHLKDSEYKKAAYRAMKTQMTVEIEEFYPKTQFWYKTKFFPSSHSLVAQMKNITEYRNAQLMNTQLLGDLEQAMEAYWSEENRALREKKKKTST